MPPPDPGTTSPTETRQFIKRLARLKSAWKTEPMLAHLSPRLVNGLLAYNDDIKRGEIDNHLGFVCLLGFLVVLLTLMPSVQLLLFAGGLLKIVWAYECGPGWRNRYSVYALSQADDVRVLPVLIKATDTMWGRHEESLNAIRRLLPFVTEEHAGLLDREAQSRLWYLALPPIRLETEYEELLAVAALQTFAHIGNAEILERMQNFAYCSVIYPTYRHLREVMEPYMSLMEARLQRQQVAATLLRASDVPATPSDTLLRAARAATTEPSAQLLRASNCERSQTDT